MTGSIYYIGDPGPGRNESLQIIRQFGIEPFRLGHSEQMPCLGDDRKPLAIVVCPDVEDRCSYITALRERRDLSGVPVLARVERGTDAEVEAAIHDGADDVLPDGTEWHFTAFLAHLGKVEDWSVLRAPQGIALVGEMDRATRVRVATTLRKGGYDVVFGAEPMELVMNIPVSAPRIVVCSASLARGAIELVRNGELVLHGAGVPWVVYGNDVDADISIVPVPGLIFKVGVVRDIVNTEQLIFAVNEVVAPDKPEVRLTPRLLYGTAVQFGAESTEPRLRGFTYNVNNGGAFVRTLVPLPRGARVLMRFRVPFSATSVEAIGQVVWVREFSNSSGPMSPPGMGLQFVEWQEGHREIYEEAYGRLRACQEKERATVQAPSVYASLVAAPTSLPHLDAALESTTAAPSSPLRAFTA